MGFIQNHIYPYLPVFAQNIGISAFGYHWHKRRFGGIFKQEYNAAKQREGYTVAQWKQYQTEQLRKMLVHAYTQVPYYNASFNQAGLTQEHLARFQLDDLYKLPVLSKQALRLHGKTTLLSKMKETGGAFYSSSGSTGTPTNILYSHAMHQRISSMYEARVRDWAGVSRHHARGMIGGRRVLPGATAKPPFYRYNFFERQVYFSAYHISPQTAKNYADGLVKYKTQYMVGYAMSNYLLAKYLKAENIQVPAMKAVLTSSEKLTPEMRQVLSEVYQCKVYDGWSGVENCGLISESEYGQLLASPDSGILEVLKSDGSPAQPGEEGELVCTGFFNYDQPLIRYKIGDVVKLSADQTTKCGRAFPVIDEIIGRVEDVVIGKDGREMVRFHGIFTGLSNIIKAQVVQETLNDFTLNIMTDGLSPKDRVELTQRMTSQLGTIKLTINEMKDIPVQNNGKFKAVISKLKKA